MSKPLVIHNARFGKFSVQCECGNQIALSLVKGYNRRSTICTRCSGVVRIECAYDGYGVATLKKITVETSDKRSIEHGG